MRAGEANQQIMIRAPVSTPDVYGGTTTTATDVATVWAKVEGLQGSEQFAAMQTGMSRPHRFTIWHRDDVSGASEIVYDGRTFNVTSVTDPNATRRELVILADEVRS